MARQSLVWTALPNGYTPDGTGLRVSVLLSPRLDAQAPLGQPGRLDKFFPDWEDWPKTLAAARFEVSYGGRTRAVPATVTAGPDRVDGSVGLADSAVWKALFHADVSVKTFTYRDLSDTLVLSYDALAMAETIEHLYGDLARTATDRMPRVTELLNTERWRAFMNGVAALDAPPLVDRHTGLRDPKAQFDALRRARSPSNLQRFQLFHTPPGAPVVRQAARTDDPRIDARWLEHERAALPRREDIAASIDFHQIVAAMGSYPTLLRRLGLVVDLVLAPANFTPSAAADLSVTVRFPDGTLQVPRSADGHPATRTRLTATRFDAVPDPAAGPPLADGLLDTAVGFGLVQLDIDGAGLKAMNFARSLMRRSDDVASRVDPVTRQEDEVGAASLRTAGLMLVQRARGQGLKNRFDGNKARNAQLEAQLGGAPGSVSLHAQDLVRGWRIDIWDSVTRRWHSLCRRQARYELDAVAVDVVPEEETTVRLAATRSSDPSSNADLLYLHEALVSWTGWSLAARAPGRAIGADDSVDKTRDDSDAEVPPGLKFKSSFSPVKGSLPRLRFGRSYWIRARAVDLAGNSLAPFEKDYGNEQPATHAQRYLRYEPVAAPVIALLSQGGSIGRPREGESMARVAIRSFNDTPADNERLSAQVAHRVAAPAQASVRDAEQHGLLDAQGKVDASLFDLLANRKDLDPANPASGLRQEKLLLQGPLDTRPVETVYAVYEAGRALTYLPDALAVEVAVRVFDHPNIADAQLIRIPLYAAGAWPEARPFVIEVYEDAHEAPHYDAATHCLRVPCPKAVRATLRLSMTLTSDALALLGVFQWLAPAEQTAQRARALAGQHWMLTPWTTIEVVHATQRPLLAPDFVTLSVLDRASGQTCAYPLIHARCSIDSTGRLDLYGEWHEPDDDAATPESKSAPSDRHRRDAAFQVKVTGPAHYASDGVAPGVPEHTITAPDVIALNAAVHARFVPKAHEFHDTRYRRIEYWLDATTRFREFLPPELLTTLADGERVPSDERIKVTGARQVTWVPSSAAPPAAKVLYVLPTFAWKREVDEHGTLSSWRRGGGLRVYLERGWNASGYGEMLAVVLPPQGFDADPDTAPAGAPYKKYVTLWGNDPIWDSAFVPGVAPTLAHFPRARTAPDPTGAWLPPNAPATESDQRPGPFAVSALTPGGPQPRAGRVDVAPHDVSYDDARQLWYCDIEIEAGASYFPFIRLALARYQPTSSPGAHLSNVVLSDIVALAPDRWLNVTPAGDDRMRVAVFGAGFDASSGHDEAARAPSSMRVDPVTGRLLLATPAAVAAHSVVEVWLERLDPRWGEDFGWQRAGDALVTQRVPAAASAGSGAPLKLDSLFGRAMQARGVLEGAELAASARAAQPLSSQVLERIQLWQTLWEGEVRVPAADGTRYRLVAAEYEEYLVDDAQPYDKTPTRKERRVVFVEHVELA
jgi:hypothetical protein